MTTIWWYKQTNSKKETKVKYTHVYLVAYNAEGLYETYMSSAIPKARFSNGVKAPAAEARRHSPSDNAPFPIEENLPFLTYQQ